MLDHSACKEYYEEVIAFAKNAGMYEGSDPDAQYLNKRLQYLNNYGGSPTATRCRLFKDFAPYSFGFIIEKERDGEWHTWFNGGLIFFGHPSQGDGGGPQFCVQLTPTVGWSINT